MFQKFRNTLFVFLPILFLVSCFIVDKKIDKDFTSLIEEAKKTIEKNLSNEERASLNLNSKIRYIALNYNVQILPYIEYKLRYCHSYLLKNGYPEIVFRYYK